jgi:5-formyltetrahydrofolate cyclo-ligase
VDTGIGFSEIIVIVFLILLFFGTKELPQLLRKLAKFSATIQQYVNIAKSEVHSIISLSEEAPEKLSQAEIKNRAYSLYTSRLSDIDSNEYGRMSERLISNITSNQSYSDASSILLYLDKTWKRSIDILINDMRCKGKKVIIALNATYQNGVEYLDVSSMGDNCWETNDIIRTFSDVYPVTKKDIDLVLCSAVAFDRAGTRLYRERGVLEHTLHDLRDSVPILGFGFDCQISNDHLPKDTRDVQMTEVITETELITINNNRIN